MTALDDTLVPLAKRLLATYGLSVTFKQTTRSTYDSTTRVGTPNVTTTVGIITPPEPYRQDLVDRDLIQQGDAKAYIAALDLTFTPRTGMLMVLGTDEWRVVSVGEIRTGASIALYELQLRK